VYCLLHCVTNSAHQRNISAYKKCIYLKYTFGAASASLSLMISRMLPSSLAVATNRPSVLLPHDQAQLHIAVKQVVHKKASVACNNVSNSNSSFEYCIAIPHKPLARKAHIHSTLKCGRTHLLIHSAANSMLYLNATAVTRSVWPFSSLTSRGCPTGALSLCCYKITTHSQ
jgi:hypothetical protein